MSEIEEQIINSIERISDMMRNLLWQTCEPLGLTPTQANILSLIAKSPKSQSNVSSLAERLMVSRPTISDSVKSLQNKGLVVFSQSKKDSRMKIISLSKQGQELADKILSYTEKFHESVSKIFMSDKATLNESLSVLTKKLEQDEMLPV